MIGLGAKKQILIVGNDGVQLYVMKGKRVSLFGDFSDSGGNLSQTLRNAFKRAGGPLTLVFDVLEQQYRRETMPKVSFMDKKKVINRKLMMAFPQQQFRAFVPLKQKPRDNEGLIALFAGLSYNLTITQVIDAVLSSEVTVNGAVLLPMESTTLLDKLIMAAHKRARVNDPCRWTVLISHHRTGGLRQVVIKDGELALTRMTPLVVDAHDTQGMVNEIAREFSATQTYLARFGYIPSDGLDLMIVADRDVCNALRDQRMQVTHFYTMTVEEAGKLVGVSMRTAQDGMGYGEILHAGWIGIQRKYVMPLMSDLLDKVKSTRQIGSLVTMLCILGLGYIGWQNSTLYTQNQELSETILQRRSQQISAQTELDTLSKQLNTLEHDPEKVRGVLDIYDEYAKKEIDIEPTLKAIMNEVGRDKMRLQELTFVTDNSAIPGMSDPGYVPVDPSQPPPKPRAEIIMKVGFVEGVSVEEGARLTNDLTSKLRARFPKADINTLEIVGNLSIDKTVQGISEQVAAGRVEGRLVEAQTSTIKFNGEIE